MRRALLPLVLLALAGTPQPAQAAGTTWATSFLSPPAYGREGLRLDGRTIRIAATPHLDGRRVRLVFTNRFGAEPLVLRDVRIAERRGAPGPGLVPGSGRPVTKRGRRTIVIGAHRDLVTDPVDFPLRAFRSVLVEARVAGPAPATTVHATAWQDSFVSRPGGGWRAVTDRPFLLRIDARAPRRTRVLVTLGASRTDGGGSTTNGDDRYPDWLARRALAKRTGPPLSVVNAGIGGNLMAVRANARKGPAALGRLRRDVLAAPGVTAVLSLLGGNDLGSGFTPREVRRWTLRLRDRLHARGIRFLAATVPPSGGFTYPNPAFEPQRLVFNRWLARPGIADGVVDFDAVLRDPAAPDRLRPELNSGDDLHPNPEGYRRMAAAVPLSLSAARPTTSSAAGGR